MHFILKLYHVNAHLGRTLRVFTFPHLSYYTRLRSSSEMFASILPDPIANKFSVIKTYFPLLKSFHFHFMTLSCLKILQISHLIYQTLLLVTPQFYIVKLSNICVHFIRLDCTDTLQYL